MASGNQKGVPAYQRIQSALRERIERGQLHPGDLVASERNLARLHKVSLMTARHALVSLEREGLVERHRGIGTFVAAPKIHFNQLRSYTEQLASRGLVASSKVLSLKIVENEDEATARLSLPPGSKVIKLERLRRSGEESFALETCYLRALEFADLLHASLDRESLFAFLEHKYNVVLGYADEEIDATAADRRLADLLAISPGKPVLRIRQMIYANKGEVIMYMQGFYRSDRHNFVVRRFR
jgi:GntR family transcriptional regulator